MRARIRLLRLWVVVSLAILSLTLTGCCCCTSPGFRRFRPRPLFRQWEIWRIPTIRVPTVRVPSPGPTPTP